MKHFGAALASYGSVALFHIAGITPEARRLDDVLPAGSSVRSHEIGEPDIRAFATSYARAIDSVDVVVFSAPQLSLIEMAQVAALIEGRHAHIPLLVVTSPQVKGDADRMGLTTRIEAAGGTVLAGMCFYQSYARELAEANGWRRLATNSAKLVNIIGGYGYRPVLMSMPACIDAACNGGKLAP
jgi:predicted aconitase